LSNNSSHHKIWDINNFFDFFEKIPENIILEHEVMCPNTADGAEGAGAERLSFNTVRYTGSDFMRLWLGRYMSPEAVEAHYGKFLKYS